MYVCSHSLKVDGMTWLETFLGWYLENRWNSAALRFCYSYSDVLTESVSLSRVLLSLLIFRIDHVFFLRYCLNHVNTHLDTRQQIFPQDIVKYAFSAWRAHLKRGGWNHGVLSNSSYFLKGTIYTSQDGGTMRRPDSLRNGNVRYLTEVFRPVFWFYWVLWFGPGNSEASERFNTDISLIFSEMVRLTFWHYFYWFSVFPPSACQSKWERCQNLNSEYLIKIDKSCVKVRQLIIRLWTFIR